MNPADAAKKVRRSQDRGLESRVRQCLIRADAEQTFMTIEEIAKEVDGNWDSVKGVIYRLYTAGMIARNIRSGRTFQYSTIPGIPLVTSDPDKEVYVENAEEKPNVAAETPQACGRNPQRFAGTSPLTQEGQKDQR